MGLRFLGLWSVGMWCGVVVGTAVVYGCVVDMCGVWCHVLWCVGLLHAMCGGGALGVHCSPVVGCGALWVSKISAEGLGGIINFWDDFLIYDKLVLSVNF